MCKRRCNSPFHKHLASCQCDGSDGKVSFFHCPNFFGITELLCSNLILYKIKIDITVLQSMHKITLVGSNKEWNVPVGFQKKINFCPGVL